MNLESAVRSLRRYARALTLSQRVADHLLAQTLRSAMGRPRSGNDVRIELFRIFHEVWKGEQATFLDSEGAVLVDRRLSRLDRHDRAALLLTCMEQFSLPVAAGAILSQPQSAVRAARERALQQATWWPEIEPALQLLRRPLAAA